MRFVGKQGVGRARRQRARFKTPELSRQSVKHQGGPEIGWFDAVGVNKDVRSIRAFTGTKASPGETRHSELNGTGYTVLYPPRDDSTVASQLQLAANSSTAVIFADSKDFGMASNVAMNAHTGIWVDGGVVAGGAVYGVSIDFGWYLPSTPSSFTVFGGDVDSNISARSVTGHNIRGALLKITANAGATNLAYSGNVVSTP